MKRVCPVVPDWPWPIVGVPMLTWNGKQIVSKSSSRDPRVGMGGAFTRSPIYGLGQARSGKGPARLGYGFIEAGRWTGWDRMASVMLVLAADFISEPGVLSRTTRPRQAGG